MLSDSWNSVFKMALKDPQKNIANKYKKYEIVRLLLQFPRPTNFLRPLFDSQFFLSFNFYFSHKTPRGLKTREN